MAESLLGQALQESLKKKGDAYNFASPRGEKKGVVARMRIFSGLAAAAAAVMLALPATSPGWDWVAGPPKTESRPWQIERREVPVKGSTVMIRVNASYCSGETRPFIHHLNVVRTDGQVVIRAYVRWPEPLYVAGEVEADEPSPGCADLVAGIRRRVTIGPESRHRKLLDGYFRPPRLVATQGG